MPLINSIEVANFMNRERRVPWEPTWPHCVFPLLGMNTIINVRNGRGKTTIVSLVLFVLAAQKKKIDELRKNHFAPRTSGSYTHLRVQMTMDTEEAAGFDLLSGTPLGTQMVFGVYGYSGDNEDYTLYSYHGTLEDCPVHRSDTGFASRITLVPDKEFKDTLHSKPYRFPSNDRESSAEAWRAYVEKWFDLASIEQQIAYQLKAGGEGKSAYFEVEGRGADFARNVFYEHIAPELLHDLMGGLGAEDERKIEDTIHEKTRQVIHARMNNSETQKALEQTGRFLGEIKAVCEIADEMAEAATRQRTLIQSMAVELGALKDAIVDHPLPGLPAQPPPEIAEVALYLVLCEGKVYLAERGVGYFSGEEPKVINQRADRKQIHSAIVENSQLIEITCDQKNIDRDDRGRSTRYYDLDGAINILSHMDNYLPEWTRESAISVVQAVFEWATAHADTNPARLAKLENDVTCDVKSTELAKVSSTIEAVSREKIDLFNERSQLGTQQEEYRRMQESGLFSVEEIADPEETGRLARRDESNAIDALNVHNEKVAKLESVHGKWKKFIKQHGKSASPEDVLKGLIREEQSSRERVNRLRQERDELASQGKKLKGATGTAWEKHHALKLRVAKADASFQLAESYDSWFLGEEPAGLEARVRRELKEANEECSRLESELSSLAGVLASLEEFRKRFGATVHPGEWLEKRTALHNRLRARKEDVSRDLLAKRADLKALEDFSVAPGQFALDVQNNVGVEFVPLHAAIEAMSVDKGRKEQLLTLFSALLFAPVIKEPEIAERAARNLAVNNLEFPVFVHADLEGFCMTGDVVGSVDAARALFIGVRTQSVECLLNPAYLEEFKCKLKIVIGQQGEHLARLERAVARTSHSTATAKLAQRSSDAIETKAEESALRVKGLLEPLRSSIMYRLESRTSDQATESIRAMLDLRRALEGSTIEELRLEYAAAEEALSLAEEDEVRVEESLRLKNDELDVAGEGLRAAGNIRSGQEGILKDVASFVGDKDCGPVFMEQSAALRASLAAIREKAAKKADFRFELAQKFVESGATRHNEIAARLAEIERLLPQLEGSKVALFKKVTDLRGLSLALAGDVSKVDGVARKIIRLFRKYRMTDLPAADFSAHDLYREGRFLRGCDLISECVKRIARLEDVVDNIKDCLEIASSNLKDVEGQYGRAQNAYQRQIDRAVQDKNLKLEEHEVQLLMQAKDDPVKAKRMLSAALQNYEKDLAANEIARQQLNQEWSNISNWLTEFTRRLPSNLDLLKSRFAPKKDHEQKFVTAGFVINAQVISHEDIESVLQDIVRDIEDYEGNRYLQRHTNVRRDAQNAFRKDIRTKFFSRVLLNPTIKVFIPSISRVKAITLDREIASSGQSVAISLLWIVKMSDFVSERERARMTVSMSALAKKKMRSIKSQFVFIDGAFSHLSDRSLIDDVLGEISNSRGRFQLIVTGHDPEFKPNWKLFPTMLNGREVGGRYMFVDQGKPVEPGTVGSHYDAMAMIRTHVIKTEVADGPTAH